MRHVNGLKGRQIYTTLTDKECIAFDAMLVHYGYDKALFVRRLILSSLKKHAQIEREKRKGTTLK